MIINHLSSFSNT